jgi:hypothetical protein
MSSSAEIEEVVIEDVETLLTAAEDDFKTIVKSLDAAIKGLKLLGKRIKKEGKEDVLVPNGKNRGRNLTEVLDLAVGAAKNSGKSYGSVVLKELE